MAQHPMDHPNQAASAGHDPESPEDQELTLNELSGLAGGFGNPATAVVPGSAGFKAPLSPNRQGGNTWSAPVRQL